MKNSLYSTCFALLLMSNLHPVLNAQKCIVLKAGASDIEFFHVSAGLQSNNIQVNASIGSIPFSQENLLTISGNLNFHLWGNSIYRATKPWYLRTGLCYVREETEIWIDKFNYLDTRIGRSFYFSEKWALELDLGLAIQLSYDRTKKDPRASDESFLNFPVIPAIGARVVYCL